MAETDRQHEPYGFSGIRVDPARRELRGARGALEIEPKAFDLLLYLIRHRDRAVSKQELQDRIWAGTIVTESALTRCVSKVRKALADDARGQELIRTVHGHGYRFVAPLDSADPDPSIAEAPTAREASIAVLPFEDLSDPDRQYFADGITEDIITALSSYRTLFVIARHSSFSYRNRYVPSDEIGRALGVTYLVEGSVRRSGDEVRVSARLIDAESGAQLWAGRYARALEDIFAMQDELAATVASTVGGRITADGWKRARRRRVNAEAYDLVLLGQDLHFQVLKPSNRQAREALGKAIGIEPENPRAHALLGAVKMLDCAMGWSAGPEDDLASAFEHGRLAIQLDDTDSEAHAHLGETLLNLQRIDEARVQFERAIELNPMNIISRALYSLYFSEIGEAQKALEQLELVRALDPFELSWIPWFRGECYYLLGRDEDAVQSLLRVSQPINDVNRWLAASLAQLGRIDEAREALDRYLRTAAEEMPAFPGRSFTAWEPLWLHEYGHEPYGRRICEGLRKAWPG